MRKWCFLFFLLSSQLSLYAAGSSVCYLQTHRESFGICRGVRFRGLCHNIFLKTFSGWHSDCICINFRWHVCVCVCVGERAVNTNMKAFPFMNKCLAQHLLWKRFDFHIFSYFFTLTRWNTRQKWRSLLPPASLTAWSRSDNLLPGKHDETKIALSTGKTRNEPRLLIVADAAVPTFNHL